MELEEQGDPSGNMAHVHPILHLQIFLHCSPPGHFHLDGQGFFGGELSETEDTSGLAPHMVSLPSLKYGNMKDSPDESHQSATPIPIHHLHICNTALINPQM